MSDFKRIPVKIALYIQRDRKDARGNVIERAAWRKIHALRKWDTPQGVRWHAELSPDICGSCAIIGDIRAFRRMWDASREYIAKSAKPKKPMLTVAEYNRLQRAKDGDVWPFVIESEDDMPARFWPAVEPEPPTFKRGDYVRDHYHEVGRVTVVGPGRYFIQIGRGGEPTQATYIDFGHALISYPDRSRRAWPIEKLSAVDRSEYKPQWFARKDAA